MLIFSEQSIITMTSIRRGSAAPTSSPRNGHSSDAPGHYTVNSQAPLWVVLHLQSSLIVSFDHDHNLIIIVVGSLVIVKIHGIPFVVDCPNIFSHERVSLPFSFYLIVLRRLLLSTNKKTQDSINRYLDPLKTKKYALTHHGIAHSFARGCRKQWWHGPHLFCKFCIRTVLVYPWYN